MKPNCYECEYRGGVAGSAHSCCKHPKNNQYLAEPFGQILATFASVGRVAPVNLETGLNIKGNPHGIKKGWFNWPYNFDPVWLEQCDGFTKKGEKSNETEPSKSS